jgi:murein DD-endopeptidase MepM/ murein hydrolase activator NlpD
MNKTLHKVLFIIAVFAFIAPVTMAQTNPILLGELTQGSLIRGKLAPNSEVKLNKTPIQVSANGDFVFGFGRDADLTHTLYYKLSGESQWREKAIRLSKREYQIDKITGVAQKYVSPPEAVLSRIRNDNRAVASARAKFSEALYFTQDFILPSKGRISGVYGSQRYFNGEPRRPHYGLDIANVVGTPVVAPATGVVRLAADDMYYSGGTLIIDHGFGVTSTFIHLSKIHVKEGQKVEQGQLIADIGATGRVTGPHLDWRINWYKERLDPALLIDELK